MNDRVPLSPPALNDVPEARDGPPRWPGDDTSRIPFWAYTPERVYQRELDRLFYKGHWCYVGLEAEVPKPGDFVRTVIGERSVILVREQAVEPAEHLAAHEVFERFRVGIEAREHHEGFEIECPLHQGRFDLHDGRPMCEPATQPVRVYRSRVEGGRVLLRLEQRAQRRPPECLPSSR